MSPPDRREAALLERMRLDERAGPARRIAKDQALDMVENALATWEAERVVPERSQPLWPSIAVAAGLLLALVGGASAARWFYGVAPRQVPTAAAAARRPRAVLPEITLQAESEAAPESEPAEPRPVRHKPASEPDDLLQKANRLRAEGRFAEAADTYAQVYDRYPRSLSAYAAQVAAAAIELEHLGKPLRAQKLYESALHAYPRGALDLEARQGLALSLRDLGRRADEARALRGLIAAHGGSPAAKRAEARLAELSESTP